MIYEMASKLPNPIHAVSSAGSLVSFLVGFILGILVLAYFQNSNKI